MTGMTTERSKTSIMMWTTNFDDMDEDDELKYEDYIDE